MLAIRTVTPPAVLPVTVDELRSYLGLTHNQADPVIERMIRSATAIVENATGLAGIRRTLEWVDCRLPCSSVLGLYPAPLVSVESVTYYVGGVLQTLASDRYRVFAIETDFGSIQTTGGEWPTTDQRRDAAKIRYVAGFGDDASSLPALFVTAVCEVAARMFDTRGGMDGETLARVAREIAGPIRVVG